VTRIFREEAIDFIIFFLQSATFTILLYFVLKHGAQSRVVRDLAQGGHVHPSEVAHWVEPAPLEVVLLLDEPFEAIAVVPVDPARFCDFDRLVGGG